MERSKVVAVVLVFAAVFGLVRPSLAGQAAEYDVGLPIVRTVAGGILGFLLCGPVGALAGAGLMCIIDTSTGCYCEGGGGPLGPIVVK